MEKKEAKTRLARASPCQTGTKFYGVRGVRCLRDRYKREPLSTAAWHGYGWNMLECMFAWEEALWSAAVAIPPEDAAGKLKLANAGVAPVAEVSNTGE
jgi:hypothetical protein